MCRQAHFPRYHPHSAVAKQTGGTSQIVACPEAQTTLTLPAPPIPQTTVARWSSIAAVLSVEYKAPCHAEKRSNFAFGRPGFSRARHLPPDSAKTYGNPAGRTAYRNTCEFPVPDGGVTYRWINDASEKGLSFLEDHRVAVPGTGLARNPKRELPMSTMDFWTVFKRPISVCPGFACWIMPKFVKNQKDSLCCFIATAS
jgi:hypothetical protein